MSLRKLEVYVTQLTIINGSQYQARGTEIKNTVTVELNM